MSKPKTQDKQPDTAAPSYQDLQHILDSFTDGIIALDHDLRYVFLNKKAVELIDKPPGAVLGKPVVDILPHLRGSELLRVMKRVLRTRKAEEYEYFVPLFQGWHIAHINPIYHDGISLFYTDVTERKRIAEELASSKDQLEVILANVADAVLVQDPVGNIIYANQQAALLIDLDTTKKLVNATPAIYLSRFTIADENNQPITPDRMPGRRAIAGELTPQITLRLTNKKTGKVIWLLVKATVIKDAQGKPLMVINTIHDFTEERLLDEKLHQSEQRFRAITEHSVDTILLTDPQAHFLYASSSITKTLGYTPNEMTKLHATDLIHPDNQPRIAKELADLVKISGFNATIQLRARHKSGEYRWFEATATNLLQEPAVGALVTNFHDITLQKSLDQQKDDFMGIVSHELKTPVTSLKAYAQVLQQRFDKRGDAQSVAMLGKMDTQINRLTSLIQDLLDVTKIQGGQLQFHKEIVHVDELVTEVVEEVQRTTQKHHIEIVGKTKAAVMGDRERIGQVVINLLTNAIKYSPQSDRVIVTLRRDKQTLTISVKDFGLGIPEKDQKLIFQRFFRVNTKQHKTVPGIGLGLYFSCEIVKRLGGKIWLESKVGKGSTFSFQLPLKKK